MSKSAIVPLIFIALLTGGAYRTLQQGNPAAPNVPKLARDIQALRVENPPPEPGVFPRSWIHGADCDSDPKMQVHAYNDDFFIIRQSKCETFEAPFIYLIFGEDKALLMDTGANPNTPVQFVVNGVIRQWLQKNGRTSIPLIVAHTHHHFDHVQADSQFVGIDYVEQLVAPNHNSALTFWGYEDYPNDVPTIDLGNRIIDVVGTPGHEPSSVTLYDRKTHIMITADIVYPGHLFIFGPTPWLDFVISAQRMVDWAATHPVEWVLGCHVEMADTPASPYQYTTPFQPDEHVLQFRPSILTDVLEAVLPMADDPDCTIFDEFVIHAVYKCGILWNG